MNKRYPYSYSILRYVHDIATGEFVNVGVAVVCPSENFFGFKCRTTLGRVSDIFPDINASSFKILMKGLTNRYAGLSDSYLTPLDFGNKKHSLKEIVYSVLPKDDSSLVWSEFSPGISSDIKKTFSSLYERYVTKYDQRAPHARKTDDDIWRGFKRNLQNRKIDRYFVEKTISGKDDEVKFRLAWKNGVWHCIEPLSFDLSAPDSIKDKAHKWLGQIASVTTDSRDQFKVYLLVGKPQDHSLDTAFEKAVGILRKMPTQNEIYLEDQEGDLLDKLSNEIKEHELSHLH